MVDKLLIMYQRDKILVLVEYDLIVRGMFACIYASSDSVIHDTKR